MTANDFRRLALALPDVSEGAHMDHPDFRVGGLVFATLGYPQRGWAMVKLSPDQQRSFVALHPAMFTAVKGGWGRGGATQVHLRAASVAAVREALLAAWRNRAADRLPRGS